MWTPPLLSIVKLATMWSKPAYVKVSGGAQGFTTVSPIGTSMFKVLAANTGVAWPSNAAANSAGTVEGRAMNLKRALLLIVCSLALPRDSLQARGTKVSCWVTSDPCRSDLVLRCKRVGFLLHPASVF